MRKQRRNFYRLAAVLGPADLYRLALSAGFPPVTALRMAAIALRESAGQPRAYNGLPPDDSYGLWQINMYGALGPLRLAQFGLVNKTQLFDARTNAAAAFLIWGGDDRNLSIAWAITDGGRNQSQYEHFLEVVKAAIA